MLDEPAVENSGLQQVHITLRSAMCLMHSVKGLSLFACFTAMLNTWSTESITA